MNTHTLTLELTAYQVGLLQGVLILARTSSDKTAELAELVDVAIEKIGLTPVRKKEESQ